MQRVWLLHTWEVPAEYLTGQGYSNGYLQNSNTDSRGNNKYLNYILCTPPKKELFWMTNRERNHFQLTGTCLH